MGDDGPEPAVLTVLPMAGLQSPRSMVLRASYASVVDEIRLARG